MLAAAAAAAGWGGTCALETRPGDWPAWGQESLIIIIQSRTHAHEKLIRLNHSLSPAAYRLVSGGG